MQGIQDVFGGPWGVWFSVFCARWAVFLFVPLAALTSWRKRDKALMHAAYEAAWAALLAFMLAMGLGLLIERTRPFRAAAEEVILRVPPPMSEFSLPSGHASVAFAIAFALAYGSPSLGLTAFLLAGLVAFGRVAAGVHYPSDVIAGVFVGLFAFAIVRALHRSLRAKDLRVRPQDPPPAF